MNFMADTQEVYHDLVQTMRDLGAALIPAVAAQYEAPPGSHSAPSEKGVKNPTLDIVSDGRRMALSNEITSTTSALRQARATLVPHVELLQQAVARWEGQEGPAE